MTNSLPTTCDCLIVGGGVVGLSLAYELSGRGQRVTLIDRQQPGLEASWAGAGILPPGAWYNNEQSCNQLAELSGRLNPQWSAELLKLTAIDNEYQVCGGCYLIADETHRAQLEQKFALWNSLGLESQLISARELRDLNASLSDSVLKHADNHGAFLVPGEAQMRNPLHLAALAKGAELRGATLVYPATLEAVERRQNRITVVQTSLGVCRANQIVIAAGAWSEAVAGVMGIALPCKPIRGQMVLFAPQFASSRFNLHEGPHYLVTRRDGRVLAGTTVEDVGFDKQTTTEAIGDLTNWARSVLPILTETPVEKSWAGLRPASPDGLPYVGRLAGVHNGFVAAGHYRAGLQFASGTAVALADLMAGDHPPIDLHPFRPDR